MNAYGLYLNVLGKPQPTGPLFLLDLIQLAQTMSGVVLSIITLQFWKQAYMERTFPCHANEYTIRMFAFEWTAGHVCIGLLYLIRTYVLQRLQLNTNSNKTQPTVNRSGVKGNISMKILRIV